MNIHIVDSIKGGSGKSTFSAKLCANLSLVENIKPCIIDLDLLGTSWEYIFGNSIVDKRSDSEQEFIYLNDLVRDYSYYSTTLFINEIKVGLALSPTEDNETTINAIFSNPDQKAKNEYRISDNNYIPDVSYDVFYNTVLKLLGYLEDDGYTDIILDMPPNSDPYSDKVLNACLKPNFKHNTNLYMVSSTNIAHVKSTFVWYSDFFNNSNSQHLVTSKDLLIEYKQEEKEEWLKNSPFKFFFVLNETRTLEEKTNKSFDIDLKVVTQLCKNEALAKKLAYYFVDFDEKYSKCLYNETVFSGKEFYIDLIPFDNTKFLFYDEV